MTQKRTILIADDNAETRRLLSNAFGNECVLLEAEYKSELLDHIHRFAQYIDIIILNITQPALAGLEVLVDMDETNILDIPIIAIADSEDTDREIMCYNLGVEDFLVKPINMKIFYHKIENVIKKKEYAKKQILEIVGNKLSYHANFDELTSIYNKNYFYQVTEEMIKKTPNRKYVIVRYNIEKFKLINELYGKESGDEILKKVANVIDQNVKGHGTYGRLEADHFAVCIPADEFDVNTFIDKEKKDELFKSIEFAKTIVFNLGIYYVEDNEMRVDQMCDRANMALQKIKYNFNQLYAVYDDSIRKQMIEEKDIKEKAESAVKNGEFIVYLQPIFDIDTENAVAAEALVRWKPNENTVIPPNVFIPIFEENGFISEVDYCVWEEVCKILKKRKEMGYPEIPISVNASRRTIFRNNFVEKILELTDKYQIEPRLFRIEITETACTTNMDLLIQLVIKLKNYGFTVLMDDFGSGYSSLNTLKDIEVDYLKIDMKFMEGFEQGGRVGTILTAIHRMAKWLGLPVVAEGIETKEQVEFLKSIGCEYVQGYYYARPIPYDNFESYFSMEEVKKVNKFDASNKTLTTSSIDALLGSDKLLTVILDSAFDGIGIYELIGERLEQIRVNKGYYNIFGYSNAGLGKDQQNVINLVHIQDRKKMLDCCTMAVKSGSNVRAVIRRYNSSGQLMILEATFGYLGSVSERMFFSINFSDATDKMESSSRLTSIIDNLGAGVAILDLSVDKSDIAFANEELYRIVGYTSKDMKVMSLRDIVYEDDKVIYDEMALSLKIDKSRVTRECRIVCANGDVKWVQIRASGYESTKYDRISAFAIIFDITENKMFKHTSNFSIDNKNSSAGKSVDLMKLYEVKDVTGEVLMKETRYDEQFRSDDIVNTLIIKNYRSIFHADFNNSIFRRYSNIGGEENVDIFTEDMLDDITENYLKRNYVGENLTKMIRITRQKYIKDYLRDHDKMMIMFWLKDVYSSDKLSCKIDIEKIDGDNNTAVAYVSYISEVLEGEVI